MAQTDRQMKRRILGLLIALVGCAGSGRILAAETPSLPPRYQRFEELSPRQIKADGWLREFLVRQNQGLTGHRQQLEYPYNTCLWAGIIPHKATDGGFDWWSYEQTAYLSDAMIRLGHLLDDPKLLADARDGIHYILAKPQPNGRLGFDHFKCQWPVAIYFRALEAEYLATSDPKILKALHQHYLSYSPEELINPKQDRHIVNLEGMLWTYGQTGDRRLLDVAEKAYLGYRGVGRDLKMGMTLERCLMPEAVASHGVTYMEESKIPAILYLYTGNQRYLDAALNAFRKLDQYHMLPDGVPVSNEWLASNKNIMLSHETCDITDYSWSCGYLLMASGDGAWADHIERAIFNAGLGCISKDFRNLQYLSSVNQVIATAQSQHNGMATLSQYRPWHRVACCAGNVNRFMPNYVLRMWLRDPRGGLAAALYGPSAVAVPLAGGREHLTVVENTAYPFAETITFKFSTPRGVKLPFSFRIPGWCMSPSVSINGARYDGRMLAGSFVTLEREIHDGDTIVAHFPMPLKFSDWGDPGIGSGIAVERGPLLYAYPVPERVTADSADYPCFKGKKILDPVNFPALDIKPAGPWNYALAARTPAELTVVEKPAVGYPFDPGRAPIVIQAPARKVKNWALQNGRTPQPPRPGRFTVESELETITLVPYGSTRLRLSVLPQASPALAAQLGAKVSNQ